VPAAFALVVLLRRSAQVGAAACFPVGAFIAYWLVLRRRAAQGGERARTPALAEPEARPGQSGPLGSRIEG
jgi:hypothetical protein